jgi:hypothetical protein
MASVFGKGQGSTPTIPETTPHTPDTRADRGRWTIQAGRIGQSCHILLDGVACHPRKAVLTMGDGELTTLELTYPIYSKTDGPHPEQGHLVDVVEIRGHLFLDMYGRRFQLVEVLPS